MGGGKSGEVCGRGVGAMNDVRISLDKVWEAFDGNMMSVRWAGSVEMRLTRCGKGFDTNMMSV